MRFFRGFSAVVTVVFLLLGAGCASNKMVEDSPSSGKPKTEQSTTASDKTEKKALESVRVYYPNAEGTKLIAATKKVKDQKADKYTAAVQAMLTEPTEKDEFSVMPKGTKLRSVKFDKGQVSVDFSREFVKNFTGGSTGEIMLVGSIVDTLTEYTEVKTVQILVEGKSIDTLAGHMDLSEPLKRMPDLLTK